MNKKYFVLKLNPSRPDFAQTMSEEERQIMLQHVVYWKNYMAKGMVSIFGPVLDPAGVYGLGIVVTENEDEIKEMIANDPAATINSYEYHPMMAVVPDDIIDNI